MDIIMSKKMTTIAGVCVLPFLVYFAFFWAADGFGIHTIPIIISQSMIPTALGLAMACTMPADLLDFSPGARLLLGAIIGALIGNRFGVIGFLSGCFIGAMAGGLVIALLYRCRKIPSMVVSLGVVLVMEAFSDRVGSWFGNGSTVQISSDLMRIGSYPKNIIFVIVGCLIFYYIYYKTQLGSLINATGNDEAMLKSMGVNVERVKFLAFFISGIFCFLGAVMQACYAGTVQAVTNMGTMSMVFKPMMGVLIATQLVKIFDNMPLMILLGEIVIQTVFNGFVAMGWTDNIQNIVLGIFLLMVIGISENTERIAEGRRRSKVRRQAARAGMLE